MSSHKLGTQWIHVLQDSVRRRGVPGTAKHAVSHLKFVLSQQWKLYSHWSPWNPWYCFLDRNFDRRFAVNTAGVVFIPETHSDPRFNAYSPTPHTFFFCLLRKLNVDYSQFTFIDFGCGKGKALLLASNLPFRRIVGVEMSAELVAIAEDNLKTYRGKRRCKAVQLVLGDARDFRLPEKDAICYFWDPFEAELMHTILENLRESLTAAPRNIYVVQFMPVHRELFDAADFLTLVKQASWYRIYKSSKRDVPA